MTQHGSRLAIVFLAAWLGACDSPQESAPATTTAPAIATAEPESAPEPEPVLLRFGLHSVQSFDVAVDGDKLHLLVAGSVTAGGRTVLRYLRSIDAGQSFSEPVAVGTGQAAPDNPGRGRDVEIAASGDHLIAVWNGSGAGYMGSGPMVTALSKDGGASFQRGPNPADDGRVDGHSFYEITADKLGRFHLVWLDSRSGHQGLRYAHSHTAGAKWSTNSTLDDVSCECCWNRLHTGANGTVFALYRDQKPRDMALAASTNAGKNWQRRATVGAFDWQFDGCPHAGGALVQTGTDDAPMLHALVWTGKENQAGLWTMASTDQGANWNAPQRLGGPYARHADMASDGEHLLAVWDATLPAGGHAIEMAGSSDRGKNFSNTAPLRISTALLSHPRAVAIGGTFLVFWTEAENENSKSIGLLRLAPK